MDSFDSLVRRLEKAVISAKYRVEHEHALLNQAERKVGVISAIDSQKNRLCALAATRDELVAWIEEKISSSQSNEESMLNKGVQAEQTESAIHRVSHTIITGRDYGEVQPVHYNAQKIARLHSQLHRLC